MTRNNSEPDDTLHPDGINDVLLQCEATLRTLHQQNRLTVDALTAFMDLSARVRGEMERRKGERRTSLRAGVDRRASVAEVTPRVEPA